MIVLIPIDKSVVTFKMCKSCRLIIEGRIFLVDLLCLPLSNLDVILGKGWLSFSHALFDCKNKAISFEQIQPDVLTSELKTTNAERHLKEEPVRMYMILISIMNMAQTSDIISLPVLNEFLRFPLIMMVSYLLRER